MTDRAPVLWQADNQYLAVTVYADAAADILVKSSDTTANSATNWHMGRVALQEDSTVDIGHVWLRTQRSICEEYPGRFLGQVESEEEGVFRFTVLGRERRPMGQFTCRISLDGPRLRYELLTIDEQLPSLVFPPPLESASLVMTRNVGQWIKEPLSGSHFWVFPAHLNMRWFGGLQADNEHGWIAIVEEGYYNAGVLATGFSASPAWLQSLGSWSGPRAVSYQFVTGGYVGLAKTYRSYALEHGLHRSLTEKIAATPALKNLLGGPLLSFMQAHTLKPERFEDRLQPLPLEERLDHEQPHVMLSYKQVRQIIEEARELGVERALVVIRGWIQGGYDETHPDIWPPDPALGSIDELKSLVQSDSALTVALHDNYQDVYEQSASWPEGVIRTKTGAPMAGGLWAGGQAYILNARNGLAYARRNWEEIKTLEPRAMFIDTTTAVQFYESYEDGNRLSRDQDEALKIELLRFYKDQGLVLGSEEGADFGVPWVDWIENRHHRVAGTSIPLWPLVFHDAAFNVRYNPGPLASEGGSTAPCWLTDILWGYPLIWGFSGTQRWEKEKKELTELRAVNQWIEQIGTDEMLSHRYLTDDGEVEETTFSSGASIIVNFAAEERTVEDQTIPPHSFVIRS